MSTPRTAFESLRLEHIGRSFGGHQALVDLNLTIARGEFIALLGPSGCGKSTALNCLAGLLPLTTGQILIDGKRVDTLPPEKRGFGMVFQNYALFPHMSVAKNVSFGLQMQNVPKEELRARVAEAVAMVKLTDYAARLPGQLSGGQQQRVAIARAIVTAPRLVLMDEPLSNLDAKLRLDMRGEIRRIHQTLGLTTVYVTHDQEEALSMADRLVVLREGRVQQVGRPEELHSGPVNWHVADFMGYRNLLDLRAVQVRGNDVHLSGAGVELMGLAAQPVRAGDLVKVGVRPDDFKVVGPDAAGFDATVEVVEYHGRDFAIDARTAGGQVVHLLSEQALAPGSSIRVAASPSRVLVYQTDLEPAQEAAA
ncbi:MAG: ABC transporter ATP-binding protein [Propionibacteriaceae bacterium]|jgi:putative spermidine/putrescine transport system ATP-binding protein|nr:ABC transporter ATP-binding protein [Propionibacteriaceae bacterium]